MAECRPLKVILVAYQVPFFYHPPCIFFREVVSYHFGFLVLGAAFMKKEETNATETAVNQFVGYSWHS